MATVASVAPQGSALQAEVPAPYIPKTRQSSVPGQRTYNGKPFPLVLESQFVEGEDASDVVKWVKEHQQEIATLLKDHGAIVLQHFPIHGGEDVSQFVKVLPWSDFKYVNGAASRQQIAERVATASEMAPQYEIYPHHELAQSTNFPDVLLFYGDVVPQTGGETPLLHSVELYNRVKEACPKFIEALETKGYRTERYYPAEDKPLAVVGRSWKSAFYSDDKAVVEAELKRLNLEWEWTEDGGLKTNVVVPGIRAHPLTGEKALFTHLLGDFYAFIRDVEFEGLPRGHSEAKYTIDDFEITREIKQTIVDIAEELLVVFPHANGQIILVDNYTAMHGRKPFVGARRTLASLFTANYPKA
ncbi:hypothetical protein BZG36_00088 [Bifiguratus adelaidae]|uniref:TauD/TfdA-like domain-containing protein n=1 Tax=Bifiguratus adelaidae TaxID=1938954 RepID=A0A261Y8H0_9FUNG|nr:hypothetical protein BZG36_00088 [Bifiguratus adelaidae]